MNVIETKKLTKYYNNGKILGVKDLDLSVGKAEIFGFIGPNGAGKSTTIRLLLDLIRPTSGHAQIFGLDVNKESIEIKQKIGFLPGEIYLQENMTGKDCIDYYKKFKEQIDNKFINKIIKKFELDTKKKIREYSKGNKQKLAIVLAFMHKPKLLLLDEPTSGLDPLNQQEFYSLVQEAKSWGATVFLSTHILVEAEKVCDRVGIIKNGNLLAIENIDSFKDKKIRDVYLETEKSISLESLKSEGVTKIERTTTGYHLVTSGKNGELIKKLAKLNIVDIKISEPSLEDIFLHYYKD